MKWDDDDDDHDEKMGAQKKEMKTSMFLNWIDWDVMFFTWPWALIINYITDTLDEM